ncbi:MAG TPA: alkaline phosphatase family protein, partial [Gemmatimonadaceae bacterium]|nr:alkaline phosphatase family protein [Gemmatimonadaceae bacterium]
MVGVLQPGPSLVPVLSLVADGARPDTLAAAMDAGALPALARLRAEGGLHTVSSAFPSVTGPAYAPFLMGRYPGPVGLPGLRWFDRERRTAAFPHYTRSYVGSEMRKVDRDLDPAAPTLFELAAPRGTSLAALNVIGRGLPAQHRLGRGVRFVMRAARTHFSGNVRGWLAIDREIGAEVTRRTLRDRPAVVFCALTGIDKTSHSEGHAAPVVTEAMRIVDHTAAELRDGLERQGAWETTQLWVVSDHGHSPVRWHEDLAGLLHAWGHGTIAHPWVFGRGRDAAVMVSGNAMAHLYLELDRRVRPWWPELAPRWEAVAGALLERPSVDLLLLPHSPDRCELRGRGRGTAFVERSGAGAATRLTYRPVSGDPLGLGGELTGLCERAAYDACAPTDYPDALVQIAHLAGSARTGEIVISASRDWDLRSRYEPIPHVSSHGALHREHMLVPLLVNHPPARAPLRTADVMPSALRALGLEV